MSFIGVPGESELQRPGSCRMKDVAIVNGNRLNYPHRSPASPRGGPRENHRMRVQLGHPAADKVNTDTWSLCLGVGHSGEHLVLCRKITVTEPKRVNTGCKWAEFLRKPHCSQNGCFSSDYHNISEEY
jgi:hypothetical protein